MIRSVNGKDRVEFPLGKVLDETGGYFSDPRFSPDGKRIAYFQHPFQFDDIGSLVVVDLAGKRTVLSRDHGGSEGIAWSPDSREIFFSAGTEYNNLRIYAVDLAGRRRIALQSAGGITIHDVARDGRWLATRDDQFKETVVLAAGQNRERDIGWFDLTYPSALSDDGKTILFTEESTSAGASYSACIRGTDGSPVVRLGDGAALDLSADGKWALASLPTEARLVLYPTGAGQPKSLDRASIEGYEFGQLTPDGDRVVFCGHEAGHADRCYIQDIPAGKPRALTAPGRTQAFVSPDGRRIAAEGPSGLEVVSIDRGVPAAIPGSTLDDSIIRWGADNRSLLVGSAWQVPVRVERLDVATGKRELIRVLGPPDLLGAIQILPVAFSPDERSYSYSTRRMHSLLFAIDGAR